MAGPPTAQDNPFDAVFNTLMEHNRKLSAMNVVLLFVLVEVQKRTDANISATLAQIRRELDPQGVMGKEVGAMVDNYEKLLGAADQS